MQSFSYSSKGAWALLLATSLSCGAALGRTDSNEWTCEPRTKWVMADVGRSGGVDTMEACIKAPDKLGKSSSVTLQLVVRNLQSEDATILLAGRPPTARFKLLGNGGSASYQLANEQAALAVVASVGIAGRDSLVVSETVMLPQIAPGAYQLVASVANDRSQWATAPRSIVVVR